MEMRRKDREITDINDIKNILDECMVCRIAFNFEESIHIVPMNYGYDFDDTGMLTFYLHGACDGRKIRALKSATSEGLPVAVELDIEKGLLSGNTACSYGYAYKSIMGNGKAFIIEDTDNKKYGLERLMMHQTGKKFDFTDDMINSVAVIKIIMENYTGKARIPESGYAYVDGSYNSSNGVYGYGGFVVYGGEKHVIQGSGNDPEMASMRNVAGEVLGSTEAIKKAIELGIKKLDIYYDYAGIEMWATGKWKRNKKGTAAYYDFIQSVNDKIELSFNHVKGHTGIEGNEEADRLAKNAVGIS